MPHMDQPMQPYVLPNGSIGVKPAVFDANDELVPDPSWVEFLKEASLGRTEGRQYEETLIAGPMEMLVNLADFGNPYGVIGYATVYSTNIECTRISILLDKEASRLFGNMVDVFELKAIGFAGVKRRPEDAAQ